MIYLDNAATTLKKPPAVLEAVQEAMGSFGNAGRGGNDASLSSSRIIFQAREALNRLVGGTSSRQTREIMSLLLCSNIIPSCVP